MRTTVTLDKDVQQLLEEAMHRTRRSFKETLNAALRKGLTGQPPSKPTPFRIKARPMGLRAGIDPTSFNKLADELEMDSIIKKASLAKRR
jgi:hypothetical protein